MKSILVSLSLAFACTLSAADDPWLTDLKAAKEKATPDNKSILLLFTGSDWCGPCIQLEEEVFSKKSFLDGVASKLVLTKIDFPQDETLLSKEQMERANDLQEAYRVDGYPTVILTDSKGRPFAETGFMEGGAEAYLTHINTLLAQKAAFDAMIEEASKLADLEKAGKLAAALQSLHLSDFLLTRFYAETLGDIEMLDPETSLPFHQTLKAARKFYAMESALESLLDSGKIEEAIAIVDQGINDPGFNHEQRQRMLFFKAVVHMESEKYDQALAALEACRQAAPESEIAQSLDVLKSHIESIMNESTQPAPADNEISADEPTEQTPAPQSTEEDVEEP